MKKLILSLIFPLSFAYAQNEVSKELSDKELKNKFVSVVKDIEVEGMLSKTSEFSDCKTQFKFSPSYTDQQKKDKIDKATECFKKKIGNDSEKLKKLSTDLNLQSYGLIQSKNMQDITTYLGDKMYKAMTGIDRKETDRKKYLESLQFKNRKNIDQKDFLDMYMTQLGKSALFELSRYCFQDFRKNSGSGSNWADHWGGDFEVKATDLNDEGKPKFDQSIVTNKDATDASTVFKAATDGITTSAIAADNMGDFFTFCTNSIKPLCDAYTANVATKNASSNGAKSCLVMSRLQEMRKAISNTQKVQDQFAKMDAGDLQLALSQPAKFYDRANADTNIDNLTNVTSMDMLKGGFQKDSKLEECSKRPENSDCEGYVVIDDSKDKALYNTEMQRNLEKEIQLARVRDLVSKDQASLKKYLEDNGYFDLAVKLEKDKSINIADELEQIFNARKEAEIAALQKAIGKRQLSESAAKADGAKTKAISKNVEEAKTERARLAQVVLFNNIITSHLKLFKEDSSGKRTEVGQNVAAWKKEEKDLKAASVDLSLFGQVQSSADKAKTPDSKDNSIVGLDMIDSILGKK